MKKRFLFPALLFVFIAIIFTIGCTNHLLKPHQSDLSILVKLEKSSGRNISTGDYQITTWIENRDGTESHHQEINSTAGADASIIFEELAIGSEINIHLEVVETGTTGKKLVGTSDWITVKEGRNVVVIVLREDSDTGEIDDPVAGDDPEDEGDPVLTSFDVQYDSNQYQLVNTNIDLSKITITEYYNNADTGTSVKASEVSNDYIISFADSVDTSNAIGNVPAYVEYKHDSTIEKQQFIIPIKYQLDASNLTISGDASVEQNEELKLTAEYKVDGKDSYNLYISASSSSSYKIIENVTISWTGAIAQSNPWEANANTASTGSQTATVTLTSTDTVWCVTTSEITASHEYEVTAATTAGGITDENSLLEAINQAQDGDSITIPNEITITNTITVNKNIIIDGNKTGTLFRSNKGTITGPMFEVSNSGNLTLQNITLDGQNNNAGQNNPLIYNKGTVILNNTTLQKNYMLQASAYGGTDFTGGGAIYSSGTLNITNSTITDITVNGSSGGSVFIEKGEVNIQSSTINRDQQKKKSVILGENTSAFTSIRYNINGVSTLVRSLDYDITPDNPSPSTYNIGDEYRDDSGALKGYVFEVNDSYIKIVATNHSWDYSWCGYSSNITDWGAVSTITDGQAMYNKMAENTDVIDNVTTIFYYAKTQKNETDSGWYIPTKDELNAVFNMNKTHQKVSGLSGDYWSSSIASITGNYTAYYVSITDDGTISAGTAAVDVKKNVIVVKKIDL